MHHEPESFVLVPESARWSGSTSKPGGLEHSPRILVPSTSLPLLSHTAPCVNAHSILAAPFQMAARRICRCASLARASTPWRCQQIEAFVALLLGHDVSSRPVLTPWHCRKSPSRILPPSWRRSFWATCLDRYTGLLSPPLLTSIHRPRMDDFLSLPEAVTLVHHVPDSHVVKTFDVVHARLTHKCYPKDLLHDTRRSDYVKWSPMSDTRGKRHQDLRNTQTHTMTRPQWWRYIQDVTTVRLQMTPRRLGGSSIAHHSRPEIR